MFWSRLHRRLTAWVALLALVFGALAPTVTQAMVAGGDRADWLQVCSVSGMVWVQADTGEVRDQKRLSEGQVASLLRDRGYSDVGDVKRDGDAVTARAKRDGAELRLRVDTRTGVVMPQQASG